METSASPGSAGRGERTPDVPPWPPWIILVALLVGRGLGVVSSIAVAVATHTSGRSAANIPVGVTLAGNVAFDLSFVAAALYAVSRTGPLRTADFGFRRAPVRAGAAAALGGAVLYYVATAAYAAISGLHKADKLPQGLSVSGSTGALVAVAIFVCVVAPICEEFFFRGFLFGALRRALGRAFGATGAMLAAAAVVGVLFGAVHSGSAPVEYLIPLGFLGFVLCLVRWRTGSLYPCMALHSANNALALGVNQLGWPAPAILGLMLAAWAVTAAITWPIGARAPAVR